MSDIPRNCMHCGQAFQPEDEADRLCPECREAAGISTLPPDEEGIPTEQPDGPLAGGGIPTEQPDKSPEETPPQTEESVPLEWSIGDVILDLYEVKDVFESGGMGKVYRVFHRSWRVDLAVKAPRQKYLQTERYRKSFEREADTWVKLGLHPHIVSCYYVRRLGGIPRLFAEFVEGGTLAEWITSGRLYEGEPEEALARMLDIAIQMAWGLGHAHEQPLVHRDVKPLNVMMTPDGTAKVTDFGLAVAWDSVGAAPTGANPQHSVGGLTPAYCSPEQANGEPLSRKTDIWSWGLSVLGVFAGGHFWAATPGNSGVLAPAALERYLAARPAKAAIPPMPGAVISLLRQCFEYNPDARPKDMAEIAATLVAAYESATRQPYPREAPEPIGRRADALNNQALSMMDLGKTEEADRLWAEALQADPQHIETLYNWGILRYRRGELSALALQAQMEGARAARPGSWEAAYLLGLMYLEFHNREEAIGLLEEAVHGSDEEGPCAALGLAQGFRSRILERHEFGVTSACLSADAHLALSGSTDCENAKYYLDAQLALLGSVDTTPRLLDTHLSRIQRILLGVYEDEVDEVCLNERPEFDTLRLWNTQTGECLRVFDGVEGEANSVCLSADAGLALSLSSGSAMQLWNTQTGKCLRVFGGYYPWVGSVCMSADGCLALSSAPADYTLWLWNTRTGKCLRVFKGHTQQVRSVSLSADGHLALSGSDDSTLRLWNTRTGECLRIFKEHTVSACLSADGRLALSGSDDCTLRLWDTRTGKLLGVFCGHTDKVNSVSLSADTCLALSGSDDRTLRLWDTRTEKCLRVFNGHAVSVSLSADGRLAISHSFDNSPRLWDLLDTYTPRLSRVQSTSALLQVHRQVESLLERSQEALVEGRAAEALTLARKARATREHEHALRCLELWGSLLPFCRRTTLRAVWEAHVFKGHTEAVTSVCLSLDGRLALSGSWDKTLRLWDTQAGKCLRIFEGHTNCVLSVCLSADGRFALSGSWDKTMRLWDTRTGECLRVFEGHTLQVRLVSLSADGRLALSGSADRTLRLWNTRTGRCLRTFKEHTAYMRPDCLSADARLALSASDGYNLRLWDMRTGKCLRVFEGHMDGVNSVCLSADGRLALSGSGNTPRVTSGVDHPLAISRSGQTPYLMNYRDHTLRLWDTRTGKCLCIFEGHAGPVQSVCLSADARLALSGSDDHTLRLWDTRTGGCLHIFKGHTDRVSSACLSADARLALSGSEDNTIRLWQLDWELEAVEPADWDEGALPYLQNFLTLHTPPRRNLFRRAKPEWTEEDFRQLLTHLGCCGYGWLRPEGVQRQLEEMARDWQGPPPLLQVRGQVESLLGRSREALAGGKVADALALARKARAVAGYEHDPTCLELWGSLFPRCRRTTLRAVRKTHIHMDYWLLHRPPDEHSVCLSADGHLALSGSDNNTLGLRDTRTGENLRHFYGHTETVTSVCLSLDGRLALSGSWDKTLRLWDAQTGKCLRVFEGHTNRVTSASLSADARLILSGSEDETLRLWDTQTGECLRVFEGHTSGVLSVCLSLDGRLALSGSWDNTLRLWDTQTGKCLRVFEGHTSGVLSVCLSADGFLVLSGSLDNTLRLWDTQTGKCLRVFEGHTSGVLSVCPSVDARLALSGSSDGTLRLWDMQTGECLRVFEGHTSGVLSVSLSADGRLALSGSKDNTLRLWRLDWDLEAVEPADWDEGALPYLQNFLTLHTLPRRNLFRCAKPEWTEEDFQQLLTELGYCGYGWLRPEGVRRKLEELARDWQGPPPLPGKGKAMRGS